MVNQEGFMGRNGKEIISGTLAAMNENTIGIRFANGDIKYHPYNGLEGIDLQWVFDNMGQPVICELEDNCIVDMTELHPERAL